MVRKWRVYQGRPFLHGAAMIQLDCVHCVYTHSEYWSLKRKQLVVQRREFWDAEATARRWMSHDAERSRALAILRREW